MTAAWMITRYSVVVGAGKVKHQQGSGCYEFDFCVKHLKEPLEGMG